MVRIHGVIPPLPLWSAWRYAELFSIRHNFTFHLCDDIHVDRVRVCLWNAATNGSIVSPPDDMNMKLRWNDADRGKPKNSEKNMFECQKSHLDSPGREPGPLGWFIYDDYDDDDSNNNNNNNTEYQQLTGVAGRGWQWFWADGAGSWRTPVGIPTPLRAQGHGLAST
jgi:hypothetical protein